MHLLEAFHHLKYANVYWKIVILCKLHSIELDHSRLLKKNAKQYEIDHAVHFSTQQIAAFSENRTESQETQQPDIAAAKVSQKC